MDSPKELVGARLDEQKTAAVAHATVLGLSPGDAAYTDAYRALRTAFLALSEREQFQRVIVTSAQPAEGKTVACLNLGSSLARVGKRVLLADADLRRPALHRLLETTAGPGLADGLRGEVAPSAAVRPTNLDGLFIVTVGADLTGDLSDAAASPEASALLDELGKDYDFFLLDTAPVLASAATLHLSALADGVLLIARARGNSGYVRRAVSSLEGVGAKVLGLVVNDILPEDWLEDGAMYYYERENGLHNSQGGPMSPRG